MLFTIARKLVLGDKGDSVKISLQNTEHYLIKRINGRCVLKCSL